MVGLLSLQADAINAMAKEKLMVNKREYTLKMEPLHRRNFYGAVYVSGKGRVQKKQTWRDYQTAEG